MTIFLAIVIGAAFGFTLDRIGATNPNYIINMLRLKDMHLMKTILLGIAISSILLFVGLLTGIVDPGYMGVKTAYIGVLIGGILLGTGFAISGYCPGTGVTAAATGRKDVIVFIIGGLVGALIYMLSFSWVKSTGILDKILGGKVTIGVIEGVKYPGLLTDFPGEIIGIVLGVVFLIAAISLPKKIR